MGIVEHVIKPVCDKLGFEEVVSAADFQTGQITTKIIKAIYDASFIVANLTDQNPNVMYELALAHAFGKRVVHIVKEGSSVPFDINIHKYISYINDVSGTYELFTELEKAITAAIDEEKEDISNPVKDALMTFKVVEENLSEIDFNRVIKSISELNDKVDRIGMNSRKQMINEKYESRYNSSLKNAKNVASGLYSHYGTYLDEKMIVDLLREKYPKVFISDVASFYFELLNKDSL